ncbi:MAG: metal-dependent transcriptional regulator [Candidatus Methanomethylophilaceae archaeon]|nr:metal-dependent transcriptional regulator [Candidatus Methanomethylophilaceae archaeon]
MITGNREDYLINILRLTEGTKMAKTTELATFMDVSPASVSEMVKALAAEGLVSYEKYKGVSLTEEGLDYARQLRKKHHVLERFLTDYLNVDHATAHEEACRMEHALSDDSAIRMCYMMGTKIDSDCQSCKKPCKAASDGETDIIQLNKMSQDQMGLITHIKSDDSKIVNRLVSMGFVPGRIVAIEAILSDMGPRVVRTGETSIALDYDMSSYIFVDVSI